MLKRLASWKYGIAVAVILGCSVYVSHQDQKTRDQYEKKCNPLNASAASPKSHYEDCDKGAEDAARHLPSWYRVFGWPEGITTWAILLTLFAIAEQTKQTAISAEATSLNAKALIESERGRLITVFDAPGNHAVFIEAKNIGRCAIRAIQMFSHSIMLKGSESLPEIPVYISNPDALTDIEDWIPPEQTKMLGSMDSPMLRADLTNDSVRIITRNKENILWVYGMVRYWDGITSKQREMRFCYAFWEEDPTKPIVAQAGGPPAYRMEI